MIRGIALGFLAYAVFSSGDAATKALGGRLPVFEISFLASCAAMVVVLTLGRAPGETWRHMFHMNNPRLVMLRTLSTIAGGIFGTMAFISIPFAEAYALIFLAPAFVTLISMLFLGEQVGWRRWLAIALGFAGVLLVVRPGVRELHFGHLAALLCAIGSSLTVTSLRRIGHSESRIALVGLAFVGLIVISGLASIPDFRAPMPLDFVFLALSGAFAALGQLCLMAATRNAPANRVGPTQYSQIVWAVLLGALFYAEVPDALALAGMVLVAFSGLLTFLREDKVTGWPRRTILLRERS